MQIDIHDKLSQVHQVQQGKIEQDEEGISMHSIR
jgi:hypothetical protein